MRQGVFVNSSGLTVVLWVGDAPRLKDDVSVVLEAFGPMRVATVCVAVPLECLPSTAKVAVLEEVLE
jgi:hypothetical protein